MGVPHKGSTRMRTHARFAVTLRAKHLKLFFATSQRSSDSPVRTIPTVRPYLVVWHSMVNAIHTLRSGPLWSLQTILYEPYFTFWHSMVTQYHSLRTKIYVLVFYCHCVP